MDCGIPYSYPVGMQKCKYYCEAIQVDQITRPTSCTIIHYDITNNGLVVLNGLLSLWLVPYIDFYISRFSQLATMLLVATIQGLAPFNRNRVNQIIVQSLLVIVLMALQLTLMNSCSLLLTNQLCHKLQLAICTKKMSLFKHRCKSFLWRVQLCPGS